MIVILEGPDGVGKSTLAKAIVDYHHGKCYYVHAHYRWAHQMHLYHGAILRRALRKYHAGMPVVIDRLWISELIYGAIYRDGNYSHDYFHLIDQFCRAAKIMTVFCLPYDFDSYFDRYWQLKQERYEMYELDERFKQIAYAYVNLYNDMKHRPDILRYTIEEHGKDLTLGKYSKWLSYISDLYAANINLRNQYA